MINIKHNQILPALALALGLSLAWPGYGDEIIKLSSDPWKPWVMGEEGKQAEGGWAVEIAEELFRRIDHIDTETVIYPYERCLTQMKTGERDVLLMAKKTPEREKYMAYSDVAATDPQLLYYNPEKMKNFSWNTIADLKPYRIGTVQGFNYGELSDLAKKESINIESVATDEQNILKLFSGRVDLVAMNISTANYYLQQNPKMVGKLQAAEKPLSDAEFHFAFSKNGKAVKYLSQINEALADMKADGTMARILGPGK